MPELTLQGLTLRDPEGASVTFEHLLETGHGPARWLVIQAVRYYG